MTARQFIEVKWYQLKQGIINLIIWLPVIWNDRQWDQKHLFKILIKKLDQKDKDFLKKGSYRTCDEIDDVKEALERLIKRDYLAAEDFLDVVNGIILYADWEEAKEKLFQEDLDFVFESLKKNIRNWWD